MLIKEIFLESFDHPHARNEDEYFKFLFGEYFFNVDEAKRLIKSKDVQYRLVQYSVKDIAQRMFSAKEEDFGKNDFTDDTPFSDYDPFVDAPVSKSRMPSIPDTMLSEPLLFIMWDYNNDLKDSSPHIRPVLIDGNHRLMKQYYEGSGNTIDCWFITDFNDISKFTYDRKMNKLS